ncbi:MAG TPA: glycine cleavage system aminomethyltransferase GcvT [Candidatus Omnitrophota bacterium]|nr:glycine cleavage system aminomethyltransferase GcvT [Candidatus Omnitrophota bacterium]
MTLETEARKLPLHEEHLQRGARMGDFGGWLVPLFYTSIMEEHAAVRAQAGVFDISHMGEFLIEGPETLFFLEKNLPRRIAPVKPGQAVYMPLVNDRGGMVDDIIVYRMAEQKFLIIVNAGNIEKDLHWFRSRLISGAVLTDLSEEMGLLALQGPLSQTILVECFGAFYKDLRRFHYKDFEGGIIALIFFNQKTAYEIMVPKEKLKKIWDVLFRVGEKHGLLAIGFGARDTLRLEAAMPLYGHELSDEITPLEADLGWAVDLTKEDFPGSGILKKQAQEGIRKKRIGFEMIGRGIPRQGFEIQKDGKTIGAVTSGSFIPTTGKNIGMAYVAIDQAKTGNKINVMVRGNPVEAAVVSLPFYARKR